ncbi:hypothetical protein Sste5346_009250 [Sporothrix stenoceras]|uniref:Uncharacterized protein n=1 Tax=Sporothrix stenoceras TaxID=5173 RepID=A0ABR3YM26_9PEZI
MRGSRAAVEKEAGDARKKDEKKPELNDALSYVDQVKARLHDKPELYNKFLDILGDYQKKKRNMPDTMRRISSIFAGYPDLINGFDAFMPTGYGVRHESENKLDTVRITTPDGGTTVHGKKPGHDSGRSPNRGKR